MPRPRTPEDVTEAPAEVPLREFSVILDGQDVTILAKDEADLQRQIASRRPVVSLA